MAKKDEKPEVEKVKAESAPAKGEVKAKTNPEPRAEAKSEPKVESGAEAKRSHSTIRVRNIGTLPRLQLSSGIRIGVKEEKEVFDDRWAQLMVERRYLELVK